MTLWQLWLQSPHRGGRELQTIVRDDNRSITIGADCAGMGSGIEAVMMACPRSHVIFASEQDDETRRHLQNNFFVGHQRSDVSERPAHHDAHVNFYVCGFPCQPYSTAGLRLGGKDERAPVVFRIIDYLKKARPDAFILENVSGFLTADNGNMFETVVNSIEGIKGPGGYAVLRLPV